MKKRFALLVLLFLFALIFGCASNNVPSDKRGVSNSLGKGNLVAYKNAQYGIEFDYPGDWEKKEGANSIVAFLSKKESDSDKFRENINLQIGALSEPLSLEGYTESALEQLEGVIEGFELQESGYTTLAGNKAYKIVFTGSSGDAKLKMQQVWALKDDKVYLITYVAEKEKYPDFLGKMENIIQSFRITNQAEAEPKEQLKNQPEKEFPLAKTEATRPEIEPAQQETTVVSSTEANLVGKWRIYSQAIFYDKGGNDWLDTPSTQLLVLSQDGKWSFGSSKGTWTAGNIEEKDWENWSVPSYGPTRKIVLNNWNNGIADGPIEESGDRVDFVWVIYSVSPPLVTWPGQVQMKFGHTNEDI